MTLNVASVTPRLAPVTVVAAGGTPVIAMYGPVTGGLITNPLTGADQGLGAPELLYVDFVNPASLNESPTTTALPPGASASVPPGTSVSVSVNAASSGHRFSAVLWQPAPVLVPQAGAFPPGAPTTLTGIIPSYLYREYADDQDLQAFVASYNALAQQYLTWFATIGLPVYISGSIAGALLDWVAAGIYGLVRPALSSGRTQALGPFDTYGFDDLGFNERKSVPPPPAVPTSDDIFRRIITWNFFKGDGRVFNIRYLKRRVARFLLGTNGTAPNVDTTYGISVSFGVGGQVNILVTVAKRLVRSGALFNRFLGDSLPFNSVASVPVPNQFFYPNKAMLKEAIDTGVLQLPFQFSYVVV